MSKRSIVVYGNCQAVSVADLLSQVPEIAKVYTISHHHPHVSEGVEELVRGQQVEEAELFIAQNISNWSYYPFREIAERKKIIKFPFLYFASLWPFDTHQNQNDDVALAQRQAHPDFAHFAYQDSLLAKLRLDIPDGEDRFCTYRDLSCKQSINMERYLEMEAARLEVSDRELGFGLARFVLSNFRDRQLFHTITHPNTFTLAELVRGICQIADLPFVMDTELFEEHGFYYQVPLHPKIIDTLQIKWANCNTRYNFYGRSMTFETYYRAYIFLYG